MTHYLYDQQNILATLNDSGREVARYTHGPGIDEPLAERREHHTRFYHADVLGSIIALSDRHGYPVREYGYSAFGSPGDHKSDAQPYRFTGREWDKEIGLYYYRARYYHPILRRFIGEDPNLGPINGSVVSLVYADACRIAGDQVWLLPLILQATPQEKTQLLNSYAYVSNNPLKYRDPKGLAADSACLGRCRVSYAIACDVFCLPFHIYPAAWVACNMACFYASERVCEHLCRKK